MDTERNTERNTNIALGKKSSIISDNIDKTRSVKPRDVMLTTNNS